MSSVCPNALTNETDLPDLGDKLIAGTATGTAGLGLVPDPGCPRSKLFDAEKFWVAVVRVGVAAVVVVESGLLERALAHPGIFVIEIRRPAVSWRDLAASGNPGSDGS